MQERELMESMVMYMDSKSEELVWDSSITAFIIMSTVSRHFKIPISEMKSKSRKANTVLARQFAMYFITKLTNQSLQIIGHCFGSRDHSTVIHSRDVIKDQLLVCEHQNITNKYKFHYDKICNKLYD